jgi:hypothetical protein
VAEAKLDYMMALECLTGLCRSINLLPLEAMQRENEQMQTLGPILEPTAYRDGGCTNLDDQRRIIDAARELQLVCERVRDGARTEAPRRG